MSTFCGLFDEIPFISADRFDDQNLESKVFFLSHCHTDHMNGLFNGLKLPGPLYTSEVSAVFLKKQFPAFETTIHTIEVNCPEEIEYEAGNKKYVITVTALPAYHCPGSVMFLFQNSRHSILYTGDFRLTQKDLEKKFEILQATEINVVYLDSTFLSKEFREFPSQIESINAILKLINDWLEENQCNKIILQIPAQYGYEYLFTEINRKLRKQIFIDESQYQKYIYFPEMDKCISSNRDNCRILVGNKSRVKEYLNNSHWNFKVIKISAIFWKNWKKNDPIVVENYGHFRVACSNHSGLSEIKQFLEFVKPKQVKLNVLPPSDKDRRKMYCTLEEIYPRISEEDFKDIPSSIEIRFGNIFMNKADESSEEDNSHRPLLPKRVKF